MGNFKIIAPTATTNLVTNPSFETNTTGWATGSTNTIAQSSAQSLFGSYSALCTFDQAASLTMASYALTITDTQHVYSAWVYIPANWDGGDIRITAANYASSTDDTTTNRTADMSLTDQWQYIELIWTPDSGDLVGQLQIAYVSTDPTAARIIYIDGVQAEAASASTTYCDGEQEGCQWAGQVHASQSTRPVTTRAGGTVKDFDDDYSFPIEKMIGTGIAPITNVTGGRALLPGADYQRHTVHPRQFSLISLLAGSTIVNYHALRQALISVLAPDGVPGEDAALIRYTGAGTDKEIRARYVSGLDLSGPRGYTERVGLVMQADDDPFWTQIGETSAALDVNDAPTLRYSAGRIDGAWNDLGLTANPGGGGTINAILAAADGRIYFGGNFTDWDGDADRDYIVAYDPAADAFATVGGAGAVNGAVNGLAEGADGTIYVVGDFTNVGDAAGDYCVSYSPSGDSWTSMGTPATGITWTETNTVYVRANGDVIVGGDFLNWAGDANSDYIAKWDGSWAELVNGIAGADAVVHALAESSNQTLYIGGDFANIGGVAINRICSFLSVTFATVGTGGGDADVRALAVGADGTLYAGGDVTSLGGVTVANIGRWNGITWDDMGATSLGVVNALTILQDGSLLVGGDFNSVSANSAAEKLAIWDGSTWLHLDVDLPGGQGATINALDSNDSTAADYYIGFDTTGAAQTAGATTVTPAGTARSYPIITIKRSGGTSANLLTIFNETTGAELYIDYNMLDGETLTFDLRPGQRSMKSSIRGTRGEIMPASSWGSFYLLPGANKITAFVNVAGAPTMTAFARWRDSFWSVD